MSKSTSIQNTNVVPAVPVVQSVQTVHPIQPSQHLQDNTKYLTTPYSNAIDFLNERIYQVPFDVPEYTTEQIYKDSEHVMRNKAAHFVKLWSKLTKMHKFSTDIINHINSLSVATLFNEQPVAGALATVAKTPTNGIIINNKQLFDVETYNRIIMMKDKYDVEILRFTEPASYYITHMKEFEDEKLKLENELETKAVELRTAYSKYYAIKKHWEVMQLA